MRRRARPTTGGGGEQSPPQAYRPNHAILGDKGIQIQPMEDLALFDTLPVEIRRAMYDTTDEFAAKQAHGFLEEGQGVQKIVEGITWSSYQDARRPLYDIRKDVSRPLFRF